MSNKSRLKCVGVARRRHRYSCNQNIHRTNWSSFGSIGSGVIESTIKQIDRRLKISGAQWDESNVSQVLGAIASGNIRAIAP